MDAGLWLAAGCLVVLAFAHSALGEAVLLRPLFASADFPVIAVPRAFVMRTLRFAWHLTSLAWLALAWLVITVPSQARVPVAVLLGVSGVVTHLSTRGAHFAWAIFFVGALGGIQSGGETIVALIGAIVLAMLGALHVAWAFGLRWGINSAIPSGMKTPSRAMTFVVAIGLFVLAAVMASLGGWLPSFQFVRWFGIAAAIVFAARTIGDLRFVGLFKRERASNFARMDSLLFTPITFALAASFTWVL